MSRKAWFMESKFETFEGTICDKCGLRIKNIQDGKTFWNPNQRALHRNICRNCYDVWVTERENNWEHWQAKYAELNRKLTDGEGI